MISAFLKWLFRHHAITALAVVLMGVVGAITIFVSQPIIDVLFLDDDAGLWVQLSCFLVLLVACGWAYDKYKEWKFLSKDD